MHSIAEIGTNVPAFLGKLWKMVEDPVTNDLIAWSSCGTSFVIKDEIRFARELLPMYYKHNNMASFIRQLNMYGFHKIVSPDAGTMKLETPDEIKFMHPFFMRGHPYLLDNIKRKIGVSKVLPGQIGEKTPQVINKVLSDVRQMKGRQENLDSRLTAMKLENGALWRELSVLRQKHAKQQQIVNKLIQFLVTIVQQNHNSFSVKRKYPRMLQHHDKAGKQEITHPDEDIRSDNSNSPLGPVIHELDPAEALLETVVEEAEADTPTSNIADYFYNSSNNKKTDEEIISTETSEPLHVYHINDVSPETILGIPEDTLINQNLGSHQSNRSTTSARTSAQTLNPNKKINKELRPRYIKLITKKPKKDGETQQKPKQTILTDSQKQIEKTLKQQLQINQQQLQINQQQLMTSEQQVHCPQQQQSRLLQTQQQPLQKNGHVLPKLKPRQMQKNKRVVTKHQVQPNTEQLPKTQPQQKILLQRLPQTTQAPPITDPVITIPYVQNGSTQNIMTEVNSSDVEPLFLDGTTGDFSLPITVEMAPLTVSRSQPSASPAALSPQDLILGSPMLTSDPVMTPQGEPSMISSSPIIASPSESHNGEMQVACVEEPPAASPSFVTRSGHQHLFKIHSSDYPRSEMDTHVDTVQNDLDSLKELLRSEGISLDANTLLGYLNDDPLSYNMCDPINGEEPKESSGNELITCNTSLFDFADLMGNDWNLPTSPSENLPNLGDDSFAEVNTPQFMPQSPSFPPPSKKRKK